MPISSASQPASLPPLLLIDDDAISREVLQMTLEIHGFELETAEDGAEALSLLEKAAAKPEAILMDTQMPGLSGLALIEALRGISTARIVAISGSDPGDAIRQAADGFLLKPIEVQDLLALLREEPAAPAKAPAAVSAAPSAALIDSAVLDKLKGMMPASAVREIYAAVASDLKTRLETLISAMDANNPAEVARIAHAIKGGCAMVGLTGARDAASRLETSNAPVTWPTEVVQLRIALTGLEGMLEDDFPA
jgi:CheY-like chemotaxis protein